MFTREENWLKLWNIMRIVGWAAVPVLLLIPAIAMQFTSEVDSNAFDFIFAAAVIIGAGASLEIVAQVTRNPVIRFSAAAIVALLVLLIWAWAVN